MDVRPFTQATNSNPQVGRSVSIEQAAQLIGSVAAHRLLPDSRRASPVPSGRSAKCAAGLVGFGRSHARVAIANALKEALRRRL